MGSKPLIFLEPVGTKTARGKGKEQKKTRTPTTPLAEPPRRQKKEKSTSPETKEAGQLRFRPTEKSRRKRPVTQRPDEGGGGVNLRTR